MPKRILYIILLFSRIFPIEAVKAIPSDSVSFIEARELILIQNAGLNSVQSEIEAAKEGVRQARAIPNPEASVALEEFGANEIEVLVGQSVELGGKKRLRTDAARLDLEANRNMLQLTRIELEAEIVRRFIPVAIVSRKLVALDSIIHTAKTTREQIRIKVEAGASQKTDLIRAEIDLEQLAIERSEIVQEIASARIRFASLGGESDSVLLNVSGTLNTAAAVPSPEVLLNALKNSPRIISNSLLWSRLETQKKQLTAESIPDLNFSAGYITKKPENIKAPLVGLSMGIPLFNRNTAARKQIEFQQKALREKGENDFRLLEAEVRCLYSRLMEMSQKISALRTGTLPKAETVYGLIQEYYHAGKASYLDLAAAQSELLRLKMNILDIQSEWAYISADLVQWTALDIQIVK